MLSENSWTEKYRPTSLQDIWLHSSLQQLSRSYFDNHQQVMPNLLFVGPPGCGKTSLALAMARHYFLEIQQLPAIPEKSILAFNAASLEDDQVSFVGPDQLLYTLTHSCHPYFPQLMRFVIIDEAERLPTETQIYIRSIIQEQKQRRVTSHPANLIRFFFMSNCEHEIFEHLSALPIRIPPPSSAQIRDCLRSILDREEDDEVEKARLVLPIQRIAEECNHDLRRAIQELQRLYQAR